MLRFVGRQTALPGITVRPGRLYDVQIRKGPQDAILYAEISDGYGWGRTCYAGIEEFMRNWATPEDWRFKL